jgi:uncharacterized delta-60 repeat protein
MAKRRHSLAQNLFMRPTIRIQTFHALLLFYLLALIQSANPASGDLDTTFGVGGIVRIGMGRGHDEGRAAAVQADGKLVVVGRVGAYYPFSYSRFGVVRYNTNDTLDVSYGDGGKVATQVGPLTNDEPWAVRVQTDGKIVVAGQSYNGATTDFALVRYNTNGTLDTSFNNSGIIIAAGSGYSVNALSIDPDGKILMAGGEYGAVLLRYNTNGTPDLTWNGTGKVTTDRIYKPQALVRLGDGKILVGGNVANHIGIARFNSNGTLDTTFGAGGATNAGWHVQ